MRNKDIMELVRSFPYLCIMIDYDLANLVLILLMFTSLEKSVY